MRAIFLHNTLLSISTSYVSTCIAAWSIIQYHQLRLLLTGSLLYRAVVGICVILSATTTTDTDWPKWEPGTIENTLTTGFMIFDYTGGSKVTVTIYNNTECCLPCLHESQLTLTTSAIVHHKKVSSTSALVIP